MKLAPVIVTAVPPAILPLLGEHVLTVGADVALYVYTPVPVPLCPSGLVTITFTAPPACTGVTHVSVVELTHTTEVAATPPKVTLVGVATKFVPVIVTVVPLAPRPV